MNVAFQAGQSARRDSALGVEVALVAVGRGGFGDELAAVDRGVQVDVVGIDAKGTLGDEQVGQHDARALALVHQVEDLRHGVHWLDVAVIIAYLVMLIAIGLYISRRMKSFEDYFVAGRVMTTPILICTLVSTYYGVDVLFGTSEYRTDLDPRLRVVGTGGEGVPLSFQQVGPGMFQARHTLGPPGEDPYRFELSGNGIEDRSQALYYRYGDEYRLYPANTELLSEIAVQTGGGFLPDVGEIFEAVLAP